MNEKFCPRAEIIKFSAPAHFESDLVDLRDLEIQELREDIRDLKGQISAMTTRKREIEAEIQHMASPASRILFGDYEYGFIGYSADKRKKAKKRDSTKRAEQ